MLDFIAIDNYIDIYYYIIFLFVILFFTYCNLVKFDTRILTNIKVMNILSIFFILFIILYIGMRPIDEKFVDMVVYNDVFNHIQQYGEDPIFGRKDIVFSIYMSLCAVLMPSHIFFLFTAILYILPIYFVSKSLFCDKWFYSFFLFVVSLTFFNYGTNTIRSGLASSIFLLIFGVRKWNIKFLIIFLSIGMHASMVLPTLFR